MSPGVGSASAGLRVLEVHPTLACNVACGFCGLRTLETAGTVRELGGAIGGEGPARNRLDARIDWPIRRHVAESLVPLPALVEAVKAAAELGCGVLTVSGGGEPLTTPERTFALLEAGRSVGMQTRIVTNGTLIAPQAQRLAGIDVLTLSILGPDAATHDAAAGAPGAFARVRAGLDRLDTHRPAPRREVHTALTSEVLARLPEMADMVVSLGGERWWLLPLKGAPAPEIPAGAAAYASRRGLRHNLGHGDRTQASSGCVAAESQLVIHADGTVTPCCAMRWGSGDILDRALPEVWAGAWLSGVRGALAAGRRAPSCAACHDPSREEREI